MPLPVRPGYQLLTRWRPILFHPSVRNIIAGRSRSETPQAVPDGLFHRLFLSSYDDIWNSYFVDWGTAKPMDKTPVSTPIKRDEKRVDVPEEAKGKEIEILWPTEREIQQGEYARPQWERKQVNVRRLYSSSIIYIHSIEITSSIFGMDMIIMTNFVMK